MWKLIYQLASPKSFYALAGRCLPYFSVTCCLFLLFGLAWGLFFAPADYQQGDAFRIIYVHVPCAFLSMAIYTSMGFLSVLLLIWRIKIAGLLLGACARAGACMAFLALITGSLWGKPMWGAWWVWDARLTSELILLFLYMGILALKQANPEQEASDKMIAILCLVGLLDLPIIHYSVYWWNTLHQGATLSLLSKPKIDSSMLYPLLLSIIGFSFYCLSTILSKARAELLFRERQQQWVRQLMQGRAS